MQVTTTTPDGTYGPGQHIDIDIMFSYPVVVSGTPRLALALRPVPQFASYTPTGSTSTTLRFTYVVQVHDEVFRLDYQRVCSQSLNFELLEGYDMAAATTLACLPSGSALQLNGGYD
jgi:hypothetical protein